MLQCLNGAGDMEAAAVAEGYAPTDPAFYGHVNELDTAVHRATDTVQPGRRRGHTGGRLCL